MLPNWASNLHCTSFPASHPQPLSSPVNAQDANYVIHLASSLQLTRPHPSPPPLSAPQRRRQQSGVRNLEWDVVTTLRRRAGLERGEKVKTKCSSGGRNLRWNGEGGREGGMWGGEERGLSRVTNLWNADSRGGEWERNMGRQREGKKGEKLIWTREFWQWWHSGSDTVFTLSKE